MQLVDLRESGLNIHSQNGEDGIINKIFSVLGVETGCFCEFGAWDGKHLSNTYVLFQKGWSGCYIEGDARKFEDLRQSITRPDVRCVLAYVQESGPNSLDEILSREIPEKPLDILSIDIDSDDLAIWKSVRRYLPTVLIIEFNSTIPFDVAYENPAGRNIGNSALAIMNSTVPRGYDLVAVTGTNLIFLRSEKNCGRFRIYSLTDQDVGLGVRFFFGYDGSMIRWSPELAAASEAELFHAPWSGEVFVQPVPKWARRFDRGPGVVFISRLLAAGLAVILRPRSLLAVIGRQRGKKDV